MFALSCALSVVNHKKQTYGRYPTNRYHSRYGKQQWCKVWTMMCFLIVNWMTCLLESISILWGCRLFQSFLLNSRRASLPYLSRLGFAVSHVLRKTFGYGDICKLWYRFWWVLMNFTACYLYERSYLLISRNKWQIQRSVWLFPHCMLYVTLYDQIFGYGWVGRKACWHCEWYFAKAAWIRSEMVFR